MIRPRLNRTKDVLHRILDSWTGMMVFVILVEFVDL